jgi:hypothetical protein
LSGFVKVSSRISTQIYNASYTQARASVIKFKIRPRSLKR